VTVHLDHVSRRNVETDRITIIFSENKALYACDVIFMLEMSEILFVLCSGC